MSDFKSTLEDLIANVTALAASNKALTASNKNLIANVTALTASNADKGQRIATLEAQHAQTMATVANLTRYAEGCCSTEEPTSAPTSAPTPPPTSAPTPPPTSWTYGK